MTAYFIGGAAVCAVLGAYVWGLQHLCAYAHPQQVTAPRRIDLLLYMIGGANAGAVVGFFGWLGSL